MLFRFVFVIVVIHFTSNFHYTSLFSHYFIKLTFVLSQCNEIRGKYVAKRIRGLRLESLKCWHIVWKHSFHFLNNFITIKCSKLILYDWLQLSSANIFKNLTLYSQTTYLFKRNFKLYHFWHVNSDPGISCQRPLIVSKVALDTSKVTWCRLWCDFMRRTKLECKLWMVQNYSVQLAEAKSFGQIQLSFEVICCPVLTESFCNRL